MSPSNRPGENDINRADTQPIIPQIDDHPGIIRCDEEDDRRTTARSIPPAALASPDTFVSLTREIAVDHELALREIARYLEKLSRNAAELHDAALHDMRVFGKLLLAANILAEAEDALKLLRFNVQSAAMGATMANTSTPEGRQEAVRETGSSIRALAKETEQTAQKLEGLQKARDVESNRMVPEVPPGVRSLSERSDAYFGALVKANSEGVVKGTREIAGGCLDTIPVAVDRLVAYAVGEMGKFQAELKRAETFQKLTETAPEEIEVVLKYLDELLTKYQGLLNFTLNLIGKMPLKAQHLFLDRIPGNILVALEAQLRNTVLRLEAQEVNSKDAETLVYLSAMLEGVGRAIEQKKDAEGTSLELARNGIYLRAPRPAQMAVPPESEGPPTTKR